MIDITKAQDDCCMLSKYGCKVLTIAGCVQWEDTCPFYKPVDCRKWIRREINGRIYVCEPEEYGMAYCKDCTLSKKIPGDKKHRLHCNKWDRTVEQDDYCSRGIKEDEQE